MIGFEGNIWLWVGFTGFILTMLALDLGVFHRKAHRVGFREAIFWSIFWTLLALAFNAWIYIHSGKEMGQQFFAGYLLERALSFDNIFVIVLVFAAFAVPDAFQHRVLFWGILGALVMRALFIGAGALLVSKFGWILYVFGAFLLLTGIKMIMAAGQAPDLEKNPLLRWLTGHVPMTRGYHGTDLSILQDGKRLFTPLFIVIVMIGVTDVIFAVDSIPAIFAITDDPFIVLTSNVFAVLGLRAMFFLLQGMADRFHLLPYGLALVLMFIGVKMLLIDVYKIPITLSLAVVAATIGTTIALSLLRPQKA